MKYSFVGPPGSTQKYLDTIMKNNDSTERENAAKMLAREGRKGDFAYLLARISNSEKTAMFSCKWEKKAVKVIVADMKEREEHDHGDDEEDYGEAEAGS